MRFFSTYPIRTKRNEKDDDEAAEAEIRRQLIEGEAFMEKLTHGLKSSNETRTNRTLIDNEKFIRLTGQLIDEPIGECICDGDYCTIYSPSAPRQRRLMKRDAVRCVPPTTKINR